MSQVERLGPQFLQNISTSLYWDSCVYGEVEKALAYVQSPQFGLRLSWLPGDPQQADQPWLSRFVNEDWKVIVASWCNVRVNDPDALEVCKMRRVYQ